MILCNDCIKPAVTTGLTWTKMDSAGELLIESTYPHSIWKTLLKFRISLLFGFAQPENFGQLFLLHFLKGNQSRKRIQQSATRWRRSASNICWLTGPHRSRRKSWLPPGLKSGDSVKLDRLIHSRKSSPTTSCLMAEREIFHCQLSNSYKFGVQKRLLRFTWKFGIRNVLDNIENCFQLKPNVNFKMLIF